MGATLSRSPARRALQALVLALLLVPASRVASARVHETAAGSGTPTGPAPVLPLAGDRVAEGNARFEVTAAPGASDVRVVIARFPFDPSGWSSVPSGPAWTVVASGEGPIPLAPLGLVDRTDTKLWWAVVWTDTRTGSLRASEARELTVVPRFANRVGMEGALRPSVSGRLPARATGAGGAAPRRAIELAAGYSLVPGGPMPVLPEELVRVDDGGPGAAGGPEAYLVQFADDSPDSVRARVSSAGGTIVSPISGDAYLVRMGADARAKLEEAGGEPWITPYQPAYKLSRALTDSLSGPVEVLSLLFADGDGEVTVEALRSLGAVRIASHKGPLNHLVRFELDRSRLAEAAALRDIAWIEPAPVFSTSNDQAQWVVQSGIPDSRPVTDRGLRGQDQVVMVCDTGLRTNHDMFNDSTQTINTWGDYPTHRKVIAYKPCTDSPGLTFGDHVVADYHGTHTSGTVAGNPDPYSSAPWSGMAKDARLYFMDAGGSEVRSFFLPDDLNEIFQPSYTGNSAGSARISSNSWGASGSQGAYTLSSMQVDQFAWNHPDYLMAFASGNFGAFASVNAPGSAKNCLTVGATGNGTDQDKLASFSSRGPTRDGRRKPTVMAPGVTVVSSIGSTRYTYAAYNGTSMATPAVSGAMALVRQYLTEGWYPTGAPVAANAFEPSAALMRSMAVAAGRNDVAGFRVPDNVIGYGRLTIDDVLFFPGDSSRTLLVDTRDGLSNQQFVEYQVQVTDASRPLKIALCWTDAPGNPAAQVQLVNDLDLVVTHAGSSYLGNYLLNFTSVPGGTRDSLNVEELVHIPHPAAGTYTVRVEGRRVLQGPQPFAISVTGGVGGAAGAVALDRFQYGLTDTVEVEVIDTNVPAGQLAAHVMSSTEPYAQKVTLTGSGGVFRGSIPIGPIVARPGDEVIAVSSGDLLSVTYTGNDPPVELTASARVNVQAPTITNVHASALGATQAVVSWTTDVSASSRVRFGTGGALGTVVDSSGHTTQHAVLLTGLQAGTTYRYDVESVTPAGNVSADSLDGSHRSFTTPPSGSIALLMDDPSSSVLATWKNAFAALGWDVDVMAAASNDPPLVGNSSAGLRRYNAVLWQVGPDNYPPFSDAQRAAIDSLLDHGGRLLVTGHDIGFGLSDAGAPSYTPEREAWIESGLKTRYFIDNLNADTLTGVAGSPISGAFTAAIPCAFWLYPDAGDNVGPAPGTDGVWSGDWTDNLIGTLPIGMHWESSAPKGTPGLGVWGGQKSRLVGLFYEWRALAGSSTAHLATRTGVLHDATSWLLGHIPPEVRLVSPTPGTVVTQDFVPVRISLRPDAGRAISGRWLDFSLDGGETWAPATTALPSDSGWVWDLAGALGGAATPNSKGVRLRVRVADNGSPVLYSSAVMSGPFTLARTGGDTGGPVLVAGSAICSPIPIRQGQPATLSATFTDAEKGGGAVAAAEYSIGAAPAAAGSGTPMSGAFGTETVPATVALATAGVTAGTMKLWVRARDSAGNWGAASTIAVPTTQTSTLSADGAAAVDFLATPTPNPFRGLATIHFGLARAGEARLELFDLAGRRVRTLASGVHGAGAHFATWNGRDQRGNSVGSGVYFVRLTTPNKVLHARVIALQ